ncbi:4-hydroxy-3-methylbut-2-enyl diphosphate reductase [Altererythrobacter xixiisoli]|uniref:4-hydroxy-3-methylbut-2-enyl diphosphate reductase n=1 Tax=Croceibacterium xixiisoli TaxID=1476466 RepID=A0A6I4TVA8_9SPHN|nr:4-hydroxy-3-methylbut-2-enyl diphosphate reductase [Croceibacterium xixiisoli]MXO99170.1 4-hydroxy-3-methylbut-2-enyl diphosphate reductase [Croceibacterium xixiisoli]
MPVTLTGEAGSSAQGSVTQRRVLLANPRGFCAGVERAIDAVEQALRKYGAPVYVRRHIVHNQAVVSDLETRGAIFVRELSEIPPHAVAILSAHGVSLAVGEEARELRIHTIDATCPLVAKIHTEVTAHNARNRHVLLIGHRGHPEIIGTLGQLPDGAISVVGDAGDVAALDLPGDLPLAYAVQTTFSVQEAQQVIDAIGARFSDVTGPRSSDICYATTNRQQAVAAIAREADCMLIVGDSHSSNANRLVEIASGAGCSSSYLISDSAGIPWDAISTAPVIGLSAGASTPDSAVHDVCRALTDAGYVLEEAAGKVENVSFKPVPMTARPRPLAQDLARLQHDIDRLLTAAIPQRHGAAGRLTDAMRYATVGGGKRLRAMLTVTAATLAGARREQALVVAAAIECVHAQSLIHDDLPCMDDDALRRGRPTVHRKYDEATAVLAGDALMALAFELLARDDTHDDAAVRARLVLGLSRVIGFDGLAAGQMMDLFPPDAPTRDAVFQCEQKKTGGLIRFAIEAGLMLGNGCAKQAEALLAYGDRLGLAFQIRDDILDHIGDAELMGKRIGKDAKAGRATAVGLLGLDGAQQQVADLAAECHGLLKDLGPEARILADIADFAVTRVK